MGKGGWREGRLEATRASGRQTAETEGGLCRVNSDTERNVSRTDPAHPPHMQQQPTTSGMHRPFEQNYEERKGKKKKKQQKASGRRGLTGAAQMTCFQKATAMPNMVAS